MTSRTTIAPERTDHGDEDDAGRSSGVIESPRDPLTRLATHYPFCRFVEMAVCASREAPVALVLVDIDGLADVNRSLGDEAGDHLLVRIGDLLRTITLELGIDASSSIIARTGASEYAIAARGLSRADAARMGAAIRHGVRSVRTGEAPASASIGIAIAPDDAASSTELQDAARDALRIAKTHGRNVLVVHDELVAANGRTSQRALAHLLDTPAAEALRFVYQPIVSAHTGRVVACEALCRPRTQRFSDPLSLFEEATRRDAIWALGRLARATAVAPLHAVSDAATLFLNMHPHELADPQLLDPPPVLATVARSIVLEIGECARLLDIGQVREALSHLRSHGFRVALDDLGAGYAGLGTLAALELDYVKLDRSLVASVHSSPSVRHLVVRLVSYARERGICVVAEGIETTSQRDALVEAGCELLQGWLFGRGTATIPRIGSPP